MPERERSFQAFAQAVQESVEAHARRKNYLVGEGVEGGNPLLEFKKAIGIGTPHAVGEIIYKAVEYLRTPRRVLLEKIAGWAYCEWQSCDQD